MTYPSWSIEDLRADGVSLKNYGFGISLVGGLSAVPPRLGENFEAAYRRGTKYRTKQWTTIKRTLNMWVDSRDPETGLYPDTRSGNIAQRNENLSALYRLFGKTDGLIRFDRDVQRGGGSETWFAHGEYALEELAVQLGADFDDHGQFQVDLVFPDPFWYGAQRTSAAIAVGAGAVAVTNPGDLTALNTVITIDATTTLVNPVLTNSTNTSSLTLTTSISSGDSVVIECEYPRVKRTSDSANLIGSIAHSGSRQFLELVRGSNSLALTADSGTGDATVTFYPPYF